MKSRARFKSRNLANFSILFSIFVLLVCVFSWVALTIFSSIIFMLAGDAIALGVVYYFFTIWDKHPIQLECEKCGKQISSNTPWVCKACGAKNLDTENFPFLFKCKECGVEPKAYRCHHQKTDDSICGAMLFLTKDQDATNYAHCLNSPAEMPEPDEHADNLKDLREKRETVIEERELALVEEDLIKVQKRVKSEAEGKRSAKDLVEEDVNYMMELEETEATLILKYEQKYAGNKKLLKRMKMALKASIQSRRDGRI